MWNKIRPYIGILELLAVYTFWLGLIACAGWLLYKFVGWIL